MSLRCVVLLKVDRMKRKLNRSNLRGALSVLVMLLVVVSGCSDGSSAPKSSPSGSVTNEVAASLSALKKEKEKKKEKGKKKQAEAPYFPIDKLSPETAVIVIDGRKITQQQYMDWLDVKSRLGLTLVGKPLDAASLGEARRNVRARIPIELIRFDLMRHYASTNHVVPSEKRLKESETSLVRMVGKKGLNTVEKIAEKLGGRSGSVLPKIIYLDALDSECIERCATTDVHKISEAELDAQLARIKKWNETASQKDKESYDKAARAKKEILAGAPFADVTRKYAEVSPEDGEEWDTVELSEFQADEPIARWLMTAKSGDVSDPMEIDDVIAIVGLKSISDSEDSEGDVPVKEYELMRCAFHAYERIDEPESREELAKGMLEERRAEVLRSLGRALTAACNIEYPEGDAIFKEAAPRPRHQEPAKKKPVKKKK